MKNKAIKDTRWFHTRTTLLPIMGTCVAGNARPEYLEYLEYLITVDPHSPNMARVNAALPEIDAWYDAFKIKKGDKLFIPANKRAHIW